MRGAAPLVAALLLCLAGGLAFPVPASAFNPWKSLTGEANSDRGPGEMSVDKKISTTLKTTLLERDKELGLAVKVHCFQGRVTLLGQIADDSFKAFALNAARTTRGVKSVATYWEAPGREDTSAEDLEIEAKVRSALAADRALGSAQIEQEVFGGKVYLLGVVRSRAVVDRAVTRARAIRGVSSVVSLLVTAKRK